MSAAFQIFTQPSQQALDTAASVLSGATLTFSRTGTSTPTNAYSNSTLVTPVANPLSANAAGVWAPIFLDPAVVYRIVLKTQAGVVLQTWDPANEQVLTAASITALLTQAIIGEALYPYTDAEIYAGVTASINRKFPSATSGGYMSVFRFFTDAQVFSCLAENSGGDHTARIQAANDFLEGRAAISTTGGPFPGGTLFFPGGLYNINPSLLSANTLRVGGHVRWLGDKTQATCLNSSNKLFGGNLITLGPDASGFWPFSVGNPTAYTVGTSIESMRISLFPDNSHGVIIASGGAHQFCHLYEIKIEGVNQVGISFGGTGGPAYTWIRDVEISGGTTNGLPSSRVALYHDTGSILDVDIFGCEGQDAAHPFSIGILVHEGSLDAETLHFENTTDGVYIPAQSTPNVQLIRGINGNSTVTNLIHIANPCNQTVAFDGIMGLTGDPSHPVGILNDVTGEALLNVIHDRYNWSGDTSSFRSGSFGVSVTHNAPHLRYGKSAVQAVAQNTVVVLAFPAKVDDWMTPSEWSGTVFTPKIQGRYRVTVSVMLASATWAAGNIFRIAIRKNGAGQSTLENNEAVGTFVRQLQLTDTVFCNGTTDTIDTIVFQGAVATVNTDSTSITCFIAIDRE